MIAYYYAPDLSASPESDLVALCPTCARPHAFAGDDADLLSCDVCGTQRCQECNGEGRLPAWGTGDQAGGMAATCQKCQGQGVTNG